MALALVTAPTVEPVTLTEAKTQCLIETGLTGQDTHINEVLIPAARHRAEVSTRRALLQQTWDLVLDEWPDEPYIELPYPPLSSVTSVTYRDTAGTVQTWASSNYVVEAPSGPYSRRGRVALAYGVTWPALYGQAKDVTVRFVAGYGSAASAVPALLKVGVLIDVASLYVNREADVPAAAQSIYLSFRSHQTQRRD